MKRRESRLFMLCASGQGLYAQAQQKGAKRGRQRARPKWASPPRQARRRTRVLNTILPHARPRPPQRPPRASSSSSSTASATSARRRAEREARCRPARRRCRRRPRPCWTRLQVRMLVLGPCRQDRQPLETSSRGPGQHIGRCRRRHWSHPSSLTRPPPSTPRTTHPKNNTATGVLGLVDPVEPGRACGSDTAHLSLLGYDPRM